MFSAKLPSLAEYSEPARESEFDNREQRNEQLRQCGANHPHVYLSFYSARKENPEQREQMATIRLWLITPEYRSSLYPYILVQPNEIWSARIEDAGHGLLGTDDEVKLRVAGFELPGGETIRD